jgi:hypothetical protein
VRRCATHSACRKLRDTCARSACPPGPTSCAADSAESDGHTRLLRQLDTSRMECCEYSSTAAANLPKYSVSPAGRPTP